MLHTLLASALLSAAAPTTTVAHPPAQLRVLLDTAVAREIYGDAAIRVASPDVSLVASALQAALDDQGAQRTAALAAAPKILSRYRWADTAAQTLSVLSEAARS